MVAVSAARVGSSSPAERMTRLVFATFLFVTLPLLLILHFASDSPSVRLLQGVYSCLFGLTHFFITFIVYLSSRNLAYFSSSRRNRFIYFSVPALIFLYSGIRLTWSFPRDGAVFVALGVIGFLVRCADFNHFNRQSFGVLQIFKSHSGVSFSPRTRNLENSLFVCLVALQASSFFLGAGKVALHNGGVQVGLAFTGVLFAIICADHLRQARTSDGVRGMIPLAYFLAQTFAIFITVLNMEFYVVALAVHYVEYHLLIVSRSRHTALDARSLVDRARGWLVAKPVRLAILVVAVAGLVDLTEHGALGLGNLLSASPLPLRFVFFMLDGIYLFHYFVESFIWRFSEPYYRQSLQFLAPARRAPASTA